MQKTIAIALNTFRESIRDRIFYSLLAFAVLMLGFSLVLGSLTIGDQVKIIKDFGLAAISLFGVLIAIFVGINLVYKEMERRTIYVILANPISRWQFIIGKYVGLSLTLFVEVGVMSTGLFALCYLYKQAVPWELFIAIIPIWFELELILAAALMFSTFASPFLSGLFTLSIFIVGHLTSDLKQLMDHSDNTAMKSFADILYYIMPNLEVLNFKASVVHSIKISGMDYLLSLGYAGCYTVLILTLAIIIFNKRDIR